MTDRLDPDRCTLSRRDFLRAAGFAVSVVAGGCTPGRPLESEAPLAESEQALFGQYTEFSSTCGACSAGCGLIARVRDGRPTKLEGMPGHPISNGGLCAVGQASLLGAFDELRIHQPEVGHQPTTWRRLDGEIQSAITEANRAGRAVRLLIPTETAASPTTRALAERLLAECANGGIVIYDALPAHALAAAHRDLLGSPRVPRFRFDRAEVVVGVDADFLGTWISPVEFAAQFARQKPRLHVQVESHLSLTGSKADRRVAMRPDHFDVFLTGLEEALRDVRDHPASSTPPSRPRVVDDGIPGIAESLWAARGRALVVCGTESLRVQLLCRRVNELLGAYGTTVDCQRASQQRLGNPEDVENLLLELERGEVGVLILDNVNPVEDLCDGQRWRAALLHTPTVVAVAERTNETVALARYRCPTPHFLAAWGDQEPAHGVLCLRQPTLRAAGDHRSLAGNLAAWAGTPLPEAELIRSHWRTAVYDPEIDGSSFDPFWDRALRAGWIDRPSRPMGARPDSATSSMALPAASAAQSLSAGELFLVAQPAVTMLDGRHGYNPWLFELPDPLTKLTWGNCAVLSPATAHALQLSDGDVVQLHPAIADSHGAPLIELPVVLVPGQHDDTVSVQVGFGRAASRRLAHVGPSWTGAVPTVTTEVGVNVANLLRGQAGLQRVQLRPTGRTAKLPRTQPPLQPGTAAHDLTRRVSVRSTRVQAAETPLAGPARGAPQLGRDVAASPRWGMVIDLDACTGCSACVVACQVENNTPVVGADEVLRHREMHWLRIDRYFDETGQGPPVSHQPMLCHQCGNAPCESVCPVVATTHSSDGLNQQIYSRCVGTRYCMNNCPFKVRRFNWFDYELQGGFNPAVLNPDVTVRTRGVAEKCTFCAHRIQDARLSAQQESRTLSDGDVIPACAQSCPSSAIVFGNLNDPESRVSKATRSARTYGLLDELNLDPALTYQAIVVREWLGSSDDADG